PGSPTRRPASWTPTSTATLLPGRSPRTASSRSGRWPSTRSGPPCGSAQPEIADVRGTSLETATDTGDALARLAVPGDQGGLVQRRDLLPVEPVLQPFGLRLERGPPRRTWIPGHDQLDLPAVVLHVGADDLTVPPGGGAAVPGPVKHGRREVLVDVEVTVL